MDIYDIGEFFDAYIECALWSSPNYEYGSHPDEPEMMDGVDAEIHPDAMATLRAECVDFIEANRADLEGIDPAQAGHDFWLTRNGHGAGFWDRGLGELGRRLSAACKPYGELHPWLDRTTGTIRFE